MTRFTRLIVTLAALLLLAASMSVAGPAVGLSESGFNFGKTAQNATVSHTFWIKSTGDDTLRITKVVPGCGCTQAPLTDSTLAPGDSAALEIYFSTKSYRGFVSKKPYLETNISEEKVYIRFDSELFPDPKEMKPLNVDPYKVDVSQFTDTPRRRAKFLVVNNGDRPYEINMVDAGNKKFTVKLPSLVKVGETVEGTIEVNEDAVDSNFEQSFTFEINDDDHSRFTVPVKRTYRVLQAGK